jgi:hypothetical protein
MRRRRGDSGTERCCGFRDVLTLVGIYHDFDYSLFYMNLRANAALRIQAWLRARHS